jgi:hypothetical protein
MFRPRSLRPLVAVLLSLLLLGAQQAAFAHLVGHLSRSTVSFVGGDESGHAAAETLAHVCTSCVAAAALAGAAPLPSVAAVPAGAAVGLAPPSPAPPAPAGAVVSFYRARAPPAVL